MQGTEISRRVKRLFGDESGVQITDSDLVDWINDACREIYLQSDTLAQAVELTTSIANNGIYYLPDDSYTIRGVQYAETGQSFYQLRFMPNIAMSAYMDGFDGPDGLVGTPTFYSKGDSAGEFRIYPTPDVDTGTIKVSYSRLPGSVASLSDTVDIEDRYFTAVVEYCLMKAYELDEDWEAVNRKADYVQTTIDANAVRDLWLNSDMYPVVQPTSEDYI